MKTSYSVPSILRVEQVSLETSFLLGSVVDSLTVETAGQEKSGFYNLEDSGSLFNVTWEGETP